MVGNCNSTAAESAVGKPHVNILLVEDNLAEARLLQELLKGTIVSRFQLLHVNRLADAIAHLQTDRFEVVLLDLTLPDSHGLASLDALIQQSPGLPIVVLTNTNDDELAIEAVRRGAQDYLVKRHIHQEILVRSLRYAIERKQAAEALREANEILELRVKERTAELETANERLRQEVERRQEVQERLELAQQAGKSGTFEWNIQSNQVTWTTELEALYGLTPGSFDGCYDTWISALHPDDRLKTEQELWRAVDAGSGLETEFRILLPNGEIRWMMVKSSLFYDQADQPLRMIGLHMDITEKKQLEVQFLRAQRLESLGSLASGIAHDLNNLLTPILSIVEILPLKNPNLNEQTRNMLKTLENSAERGANLVKQILSFARGSEGNQSCLQMAHLLKEIKQIFQETLPKSIHLQTNLAPDLWTISGDATQLHQVFMNLCVNARDAMPNGGTLSIVAENVVLDEQQARLYLEAHAGLYAVITVSDTGMGISPDILHRIFDPFFTTKEIGKGTGLGLSAVLGIVKRHNGFVDVQSEVGKGSQFKVFFPACESPSMPQENDLEMYSGNQELILVVDDEAAICEITKTTLEAYNYRVITASDGVEAIALFAGHRENLQCVLMDIMMPSMDGLATIPLLQRFNPNAYIVAMSGLHSPEIMAQAERMGFQSFLSKPFTTKDLLQVLQTGLKTEHDA